VGARTERSDNTRCAVRRSRGFRLRRKRPYGSQKDNSKQIANGNKKNVERKKTGHQTLRRAWWADKEAGERAASLPLRKIPEVSQEQWNNRNFNRKNFKERGRNSSLIHKSKQSESESRAAKADGGSPMCFKCKKQCWKSAKQERPVSTLFSETQVKTSCLKTRKPNDVQTRGMRIRVKQTRNRWSNAREPGAATHARGHEPQGAKD